MSEIKTTPFELQPFPGSSAPAIQISGNAERSDDQLNLTYQVTGAIDQLLLPLANPSPERQWELWEATCCEAFLGIPDRKDYWEVNLSPNGNWNVFSLQDYREGLVIENRITGLQITTERSADRFCLSSSIPLGAIGLDSSPIELGITAVIQTQAGELSYWAIAHCGAEADFHLRDSFALSL